MFQQMTYRDVSQAGVEPIADRIDVDFAVQNLKHLVGELEFTLLNQLKGGNGGDRFGDARDAEEAIWSNMLACRNIGIPVSTCKDNTSSVGDCDGGAGHSMFLHEVMHQAVETDKAIVRFS